MKKIAILSIILAFNLSMLSQSNLKFSYDGSGNLKQKTSQVSALKIAMPEPKKTTASPDSVLSFKVYPNPAQDIVNIEGKLNDNNSVAEIVIFNSINQEVKKIMYYGNRTAINIDDLQSGVYLLNVYSGSKQIAAYKILINK